MSAIDTLLQLIQKHDGAQLSVEDLEAHQLRTPHVLKEFMDVVSKDANYMANIPILLLNLLSLKSNLLRSLDTNMLQLVLERILEDPNLSSEWTVLAKRLIEIGATRSALQWIFTRPIEKFCQLYAILEHGLRQALPKQWVFDTRQAGHASIEFASLPRLWPPSHGGYSFLTWLFLDDLPKEMHATIFGAFDPTHKSFTMLYIEKRTGCLILQTSLTTSIRFSFKFTSNLWYQIAVVHKRSTTTASSRATLFVNGKQQECLKITFPMQPPASTPVRAFLGSLSAFKNPNTGCARYSLGQTLLVDQILVGSLINIYHKLGVQYTGNFQDLLGGFMTYSASADLSANPCDDSSSLRPRNSENMPENRLFLSVCGQGTLDSAKQMNTGLVVINQAIPYISDSLRDGRGVGILSGNVQSIVSRPLIDNLHTVGGMVALLKLLEVSNTPAQFSCCLNLSLNAISFSARNSEDMERIRGYEILALIMKKRADMMSGEVLKSVLDFIGLPLEIINNSLAYRALLMKFLIWSSCPMRVRLDHLNHFRILFSSTSYADYNSVRLTKMNFVRKVLQQLRLQSNSQIHQALISILRHFLELNFTAENVRMLSTFIVHQMYSTRASQGQLTINSAMSGTSVDDQRPVARQLLIMLESLLQDDETDERINKFATTVTNRWILVLLSDEQSAPLGLSILSRLLASQGTSYVSRFAGKSDGFRICESVLERRHASAIWQGLFAIFLGYRAKFQSSDHTLSIVYPERTDQGRYSKVAIVPECFSSICRLMKRCAIDMSGPASHDTTIDPRDVQRKQLKRKSLDVIMGDALRQEQTHARSLQQDQSDVAQASKTFDHMSRLWAELRRESDQVRNYLNKIPAVRLLLEVLFYSITGPSSVNVDDELKSRKHRVSRSACSAASEQVTTTSSELASIRKSAPVRLFSSAPNESYETSLARTWAIFSDASHCLFDMILDCIAYNVKRSKDFTLVDILVLPPAYSEEQDAFLTLLLHNIIARMTTEKLKVDDATTFMQNVHRLGCAVYQAAITCRYQTDLSSLIRLLGEIIDNLPSQDVDTLQAAVAAKAIQLMRKVSQSNSPSNALVDLVGTL